MFLKKFDSRSAEDIADFVNKKGILKEEIQQIVYNPTDYRFYLFYWSFEK